MNLFKRLFSKKVTPTKPTEILAVFEDRKGFTRQMKIEYPPRPYFEFIERPPMTFGYIQAGVQPEVLNVVKVRFMLSHDYNGTVYYVQD